MWTKQVEIWWFKKTTILDEDGEIVQEEDGEAWSQRLVSTEEVEEGYEL